MHIHNSGAFQENMLIDERKSVDKTSIDSPSRLYMKSLMDHSNKDSNKKNKVINAKAGLNKNSKANNNLKLTGKSIVES